MSEFTIKGFSKLFEIKGYSELAQFFSTSFDFTDRIENGLVRVAQELSEREEASKFSMSAYPVWEEEGKPFISAYLSCSHHEGKFSINSLDLSYNNGVYNGQVHSKTLEYPTLTDIPDKEMLKRELKRLTQGPDFKESRTNNKNLKL